MGSLFGGKEKTSSTSTTTINVPDWIQSVQQDYLSRAQGLANTPFQPYDPNDRIASLSGDEAQAYDLLRNNIGAYQPAYGQAMSGLGTVFDYAQNGIPQEYLDKYMNPYTENVLDIAQRRAIENYDMQKKQLQGQAAQAGAFGGSRFGLQQAYDQEAFRRQLQEQETLGLHDAYTQGLGGAERGLERLRGASLSTADLANSNQGAVLRDVAGLEAAGKNQRGIEQALLDAKYGEFLREQAYPYEQLQFLQGVAQPLSDIYRGNTNQGTQTVKSGGGLGNALLGIGMAAMGFPGVGAAVAGSGMAEGGVVTNSYGDMEYPFGGYFQTDAPFVRHAKGLGKFLSGIATDAFYSPSVMAKGIGRGLEDYFVEQSPEDKFRKVLKEAVGMKTQGSGQIQNADDYLKDKFGLDAFDLLMKGNDSFIPNDTEPQQSIGGKKGNPPINLKPKEKPKGKAGPMKVGPKPKTKQEPNYPLLALSAALLKGSPYTEALGQGLSDYVRTAQGEKAAKADAEMEQKKFDLERSRADAYRKQVDLQEVAMNNPYKAQKEMLELQKLYAQIQEMEEGPEKEKARAVYKAYTDSQGAIPISQAEKAWSQAYGIQPTAATPTGRQVPIPPWRR